MTYSFASELYSKIAMLNKDTLAAKFHKYPLVIE